MASACAALTAGDSTLVRDFQPLNWSNDWAFRRLVRHVADDLVTSKGHPSLTKPASIPELINAIEQPLPVGVASHVSL